MEMIVGEVLAEEYGSRERVVMVVKFLSYALSEDNIDVTSNVVLRRLGLGDKTLAITSSSVLVSEDKEEESTGNEDTGGGGVDVYEDTEIGLGPAMG